MTGNSLARQKAALRANFGTTLTYGGSGYAAITTALDLGEHALLLEGTGVNAAAADLRLFDLSPSSFPTFPAVLAPGQFMIWQGDSYTIIKAIPDVCAGTLTGLLVYAYRTPSPAAATTPGNAPQRETFWPPATTVP